jgi:hypothetical protein
MGELRQGEFIRLSNVSRLTPRSSAIYAIVAPGPELYNATASTLN